MTNEHWTSCIALCSTLLAPAVTGCSQAPERKFRVVGEKEQAEQFDHDNPVGRFTAIEGGSGGIYVLDTRKGTVRYCVEATANKLAKDWETVNVGCTTPSKVSGKQLSPTIRELE